MIDLPRNALPLSSGLPISRRTCNRPYVPDIPEQKINTSIFTRSLINLLFDHREGLNPLERLYTAKPKLQVLVTESVSEAATYFKENHVAFAIWILLRAAQLHSPTSVEYKKLVHLYQEVEEVVIPEEKNEGRDSLKKAVTLVVHASATPIYLSHISNNPGGSEEMGELASSPIFRCILRRVDGDGAYVWYRLDLILFLVLGVCFTWLTWLQASSSDATTTSAGMISMWVVSCIITLYFICRELLQISKYRQIEQRDLKKDFEGVEQVYRCCVIIPFIIIVGLIASPVLLFVFVLKKYLPEVWNRRSFFERLLEQQTLGKIWSDPMTFFYFPKSYRGDFWNWIDILALTTVTAVLVQLAESVFHGRQISEDIVSAEALVDHKDLVTVAIFALWIKLLGFMQSFDLKFAAFVIMLKYVIAAIREFVVVLIAIITMFVHALYYRNSEIDASDFEYHDEGAPSPFYSVGSLYQSLVLLALGGEFDADSFPTPWDKILLDLFLFMVVVVLMNILIAVVSDEYDRCVANTCEIYWSSCLTQITEATLVLPKLPKIFHRKNDEGSRTLIVEEELFDGNLAQERLLGRTQDITYRIDQKLKKMESRSDQKMQKMESRIDQKMQKMEALMGEILKKL